MCSLNGGSAAPRAREEAERDVVRANGKGTMKENSSACLFERSTAVFCPVAGLLVEINAVFLLWEGVGQVKP